MDECAKHARYLFNETLERDSRLKNARATSQVSPANVHAFALARWRAAARAGSLSLSRARALALARFLSWVCASCACGVSECAWYTMEQTRAEKTAVLVVGNEIMSGSIRDENGHFLLAELRQLGLHTEELVLRHATTNHLIHSSTQAHQHVDACVSL